MCVIAVCQYGLTIAHSIVETFKFTTLYKGYSFSQKKVLMFKEEKVYKNRHVQVHRTMQAAKKEKVLSQLTTV